MPLPALLNPSIIQEAAELMGAKFPQILSYFLEDSAAYVADMHAALASGNLQGLILPAHSLKSSAKQMGADRLSYHARELEHAAREAEKKPADPSALSTLLASLEQALADSRAAYTEYTPPAPITLVIPSHDGIKIGHYENMAHIACSLL